MSKYTSEEQREHRKELCQVLRSGELPQVGGRLGNETGCCVLGASCIVAGRHGISLNYNDCEPDNYWYHTLQGAGLECHPEVQEWYGFRDHNGAYQGDSYYDSLRQDNDWHHKTFPELADIIEQEPEGLFVTE